MSNRSPSIVLAEAPNPDHVTTTQLCETLKISKSGFHHRYSRGQFGDLKPIVEHGRGTEAVWSVSGVRAAAAAWAAKKTAVRRAKGGEDVADVFALDVKPARPSRGGMMS